MIYAFTHLEKGEATMKIFSVYAHDAVEPYYIVKAVIIREDRPHYLPSSHRFKTIEAAEKHHFLLVDRCKDAGYKKCK